jgi:hypothetical protein
MLVPSQDQHGYEDCDFVTRAYVVDVEYLAINCCSDLGSFPFSRSCQSVTRTKLDLSICFQERLGQLRQYCWNLVMHGEICRSKPLGCQEVGSINNYFSIKVVMHLKFHDVPALLLKSDSVSDGSMESWQRSRSIGSLII